MEEIINKINDIFAQHVRTRGVKISNKTDFVTVLNQLTKIWDTLNREQIDTITEVFCKKEQKHYLGDIKWVLYQYICDLNCDEGVIIRCGRYAYDKIQRLGEGDAVKGCANQYLNGEIIIPYLVSDLDKKQIIISKFEGDIAKKLYNAGVADTTIYPDDIVLYFA